MNEREFWKRYELTHEEICTAIECFYTWLEINNSVSTNKAIYTALNEHSRFWNIILYALQSSFFVVLGRIFDNGKNAHSIHKFIASCLAYPEFFSKEALARRKQEEGLEPDLLDEFMKDTYEPTTEDFRNLKKALTAHRRRFDKIYRGIRNDVFAHKIANEVEKKAELFGKTKIGNIEDMLYFLYDFLKVVWQLYHNGRKPTLGGMKYDYKDRISKTVQGVLGKLQNEGSMKSGDTILTY
jgi:hypothetical protein